MATKELGVASLASPSLGSNATLSILQKLANGIPMTKFSLILLAVIPFTGILGMNNAAMGNSSIALLKSSSFLISGGLITFMIKYYPWFLRRPILWFSMLGPWFIFDIFELFDTVKFNTLGFRLPLDIEIPGLTKEPPNQNGNWILTTPLALSISAALATSGVAIAKYIPANILPASIGTNIALFSGGAGLLCGIGAVVLAVSSSAPSPTLAANPLSSPMVNPLTPFAVGGGSSGGGSAKGLPPLSHFADKLLTSKDESYAFFAVLALVVMGGLVTSST
jgi:hypothetical protein